MVRKWQRWSSREVVGALAVLGILGAASARAEDLAAAPPTWQQQYGSVPVPNVSSGDDLALAVATSHGEVYSVGYTNGPFGGEPAKGQDIFVVKHGTDGTLRWVRQFGSDSNDRALAVAADLAGNVYVAGYTWGSLEPGFINKGGTDIFLAKYDAEGVRQWVRQLGTESDDYATGIAVRHSGQEGLVITGYSLGRFDGTPSPGNYDVVVAKYDLAGNPFWLRQFGTIKSDVALAITLSDAEDIYITGYTYGSLDGVSPGTSVDLFVARYDILGTQRWVRQRGSTNDDQGTGIAVDANGGVYVSGFTSGSLDGNTRAGTTDAVLVKFNVEGEWLWSRQLGTTTTDYGQAVAVGPDGLIHLAGYTSGSLDGNVSLGGSDLFVSTYDAEGGRLVTRQAGTSGTDRGQGVSVSVDGALYLAGYTWSVPPSGTSHYDALLIRY